ncbi:MAG TPA: DUF72 domain-containing protein [Bryobacteraceae bacterium]|nr:DUF72 domain-containing protein [Bryobacteraceae bacterium]
MIRVGPAGWSYKDWKGIVYPEKRSRGFSELGFIANYFDTVEINSSFYGAPRATSAKQWVEHVAHNANFQFTAKLFHSFTHERKPAPNDEQQFKDGIAPLVDAKLLGALLLQFPWSFKNEPENRQYLIGLQKRFQEYPLVLEVRHASWVAEDILDLLSELGIGICNIDQPLFSRSIKPAAAVTSRIGYVRLHGRNYANWFSKKADVRERYDHLYTPQELDPWVDRTRQIAAEAGNTYFVTNNHNLGKAVVNALEITSMLGGKLPRMPPDLVAHYPELREFTLR